MDYGIIAACKNDKGFFIMTEENLNKESHETTIDITEILKILRTRIFIILVFFVIGAVVGFVFATAMSNPVYKSEAVFMVDASSESSGNASTDLSNSKNIVANIVKVGNQNKFRRFVIERLQGTYDFEITEELMEEWITFVTNTSSSSITSDSSITIKVVTPHSGLSFEIAAIINANFENYIKENYKITETTNIAISSIAYPEQATEPESSYSRFVYALVGGVLLVAVYCIVEIIIVVNDNRIKDETAIEKEFGVPLLGILPHFPEESDEESKS